MLEVFHLCWNDAVCQEMQADPQRTTQVADRPTDPQVNTAPVPMALDE